MRCPACQHTATETTAACPECGFSLPALDRLLGTAPTLSYPVSDFQAVLRAKEMRVLQQRVQRLEHLFPGLRCGIVTTKAPEQVGLGLYTLWLFNRGQLTSAVEQGKNNRLVLLVISPQERKASCMVGYALEPLLSPEILRHCLDAMKPSFSEDVMLEGVLAFLAELETQLKLIIKAIPQTYGIHPDEYQGLRALMEQDSEELELIY